MNRVGFIGWRGMVGSVLMERMRTERDFDEIDPVFFERRLQDWRRLCTAQLSARPFRTNNGYLHVFPLAAISQQPIQGECRFIDRHGESGVPAVSNDRTAVMEAPYGFTELKRSAGSQQVMCVPAKAAHKFDRQTTTNGQD